MSAITSIYAAPVTHERIPKSWGTTYVSIKYNGKCYLGTTMCDYKNREFFSERVGRRIALSRARTQALQEAYESANNEANIKERMYREVLNFGSGNPDELDPTGTFWRNTFKARTRANDLRLALDNEKACLKNYLKELETFTTQIRKNRAKIDKKP